MRLEDLKRHFGEFLHGYFVSEYERKLREQFVDLNDLFMLQCFMELVGLPNPAAIYLLDERVDDPHAPFVATPERTDGLLALIANTYGTKLIDKQMRAREFDVLSRVLARVPLRRVTPHSDAGRLAQLCDLVLSDFKDLHV